MRKALFSGLLLGALSFLLPPSAAADDLTEDPLRHAAQQGDMAAQLKLGDEFFFGRGDRTRNPELAVYWFRRAAEQGSAEAAYNLGVCLEHGWGVEQSRIRALEMYAKAAGAGRPEAELRRALLLFHGVPAETLSSGPLPAVEADRQEALTTLRRLARSGFAPARQELAKLLLGIPELRGEFGAEIRTNLEELAALPDAEAETLLLLADCLREGIGGTSDFERMTLLLGRAAALGNPEAKARYAEALEYGLGCSPDRAKAFQLIREAADAGNPRAQVRFGDACLSGEFVPHDPVAAFGWFEKAAAQDYAPAYFKLGNAYDRGIGVPEDPVRAFEEYGKAARMGYGPAQYRFGLCFLNGRGIAADPAGATFWFRNAIGRGNVDAMRKLGVCLLQGRGIEKDQAEGLKLLQAAAAAGDTEAILLLNR